MELKHAQSHMQAHSMEEAHQAAVALVKSRRGTTHRPVFESCITYTIEADPDTLAERAAYSESYSAAQKSYFGADHHEVFDPGIYAAISCRAADMFCSRGPSRFLSGIIFYYR